MNAKDFFSDRPIAYHPILAKICGSVTAALFLSQLAYWNDKGNSRDGWIWKTAEEMHDETGLSRSEQSTARKVLISKKIIQEQRRGIPARMWYLIDWQMLNVLIDEYQKERTADRANKLSNSCNLDVEKVQTVCLKPANYSETIQETTSEIKETSAKPAPAPSRAAPPIPITEPIKAKPIPKENNNYAMAQALADVSGMNFVVNKGRLFKNAKELLKVPGITPEDIRRDYGEGGDWYRYDWRGKQGEKPTPEAVRATLGNLSNNGKGSRQPLLEKQTPEQIREIAELLRKGKENK